MAELNPIRLPETSIADSAVFPVFASFNHGTKSHNRPVIDDREHEHGSDDMIYEKNL